MQNYHDYDNNLNKLYMHRSELHGGYNFISTHLHVKTFIYPHVLDVKAGYFRLLENSLQTLH